MKLSIIIPCYNEAATIQEVARQVSGTPLPQGWEREIIVVDDGSGEETQRSLDAIVGEHVRIIRRPKNGGKGAAVKDGLRHATGDWMITQDADLEYDPNEYHILLQPIVAGEALVVFGSRNLGTNNVPYSAIFFYGGLLTTKVFNLLFRTSLTDIATCYKVFPASIRNELLASPHDDFVFDAVDLTLACVRVGALVEVPVSYRARSKKSGKKLNFTHGIEIVMSIGIARLGIPQQHRAHASKTMRFLIAGSIAAVVHLVFLFLLTEFVHLWYVASSGLAFMVAFTTSFALQKYWTFRSKENHKIRRQLPMHLGVAVFNLGLDMMLIYVLVEFFGFWYLLAQAMVTVAIAVWSYFALRWIFR